MRTEDLVAALENAPVSPLREDYLAFVSARGGAAHRRSLGDEHVTASCFVFSPDLRQVLLCFHRKGRFWVQFGGHIEERDATVAEAARREAREESGIGGLELLSERIADLDRHELHGGFTCAVHWDIGFVAVVSTDTAVSSSDESEDVRWFSVDDLPGDVPSEFPARMRNLRELVPSLSVPSGDASSPSAADH
ncbi:NUDIX hydrolase [Planctomonas psychrotolerans]|uniref:NUDIX hydrolase n=1 Tax=Planctomonas psychrotolerans TaxID=2528712 RepID=UPI00123AD353|nr:NUDIX domain-containing protein [Planctomonas psychrotolerans]